MESDWKRLLEELWQHRGKVIGAGLGLLAGIFVLLFGFWRTLLLVILLALGYTVGGRIDAGQEPLPLDRTRIAIRKRRLR